MLPELCIRAKTLAGFFVDDLVNEPEPETHQRTFRRSSQ